MKTFFRRYLLLAILVLVILVWIVQRVPKTSTPAIEISTLGWSTFSDGTVSFQYPPKLPTKYITASDWPPKVQILDQSFSCTQAGDITRPAGKTELTSINGHSYCLTIE